VVGGLRSCDKDGSTGFLVAGKSGCLWIPEKRREVYFLERLQEVGQIVLLLLCQVDLEPGIVEVNQMEDIRGCASMEEWGACRQVAQYRWLEFPHISD
jgi:hypothetical protein